MHEKGRSLINKAMKEGKIKGLDKNCKYLPCHNDLEDCTFCFCPFYPCYQKDTGGYEKISSTTGKPVWVCTNCNFIHKTKIAKEILKELIQLGSNIDMISKNKLLQLRLKVLKIK